MTDIAPLSAARARAERIRVGIHSFIATRKEIADAYRDRDWAALGYDSWETYVDGEFSEARVRLTADERREAVAELRLAGMSQRAIGTTLGVSQSTVRDDIAELSTSTQLPDRIVSADGKERPASRPVPTPKPVDPAEMSRAIAAEVLQVLAIVGPNGASVAQISERGDNWPLGIVIAQIEAAVRDLADDGQVEPAGRGMNGNRVVDLWALAELAVDAPEDHPAAKGEGRSAGLPPADAPADESDASVVGDVAADELPDPLAGVGDEYRTDPAERIASVAEIAPEFARPAEPGPAAMVAAALDQHVPDLNAGMFAWRRDLHTKLKPAHHVTLWLDIDDAAEFASDDDIETIRQLGLSFADLHRRITAARNGNVVQLRAVQ